MFPSSNTLKGHPIKESHQCARVFAQGSFSEPPLGKSQDLDGDKIFKVLTFSPCPQKVASIPEVCHKVARAANHEHPLWPHRTHRKETLNHIGANARTRAAVSSGSGCSAYERPPGRGFEIPTLTGFPLNTSCPLNTTSVPIFLLSSPMAISRCPKENNGLSLKRKQTHKSGFCSCHCAFSFTFI